MLFASFCRCLFGASLEHGLPKPFIVHNILAKLRFNAVQVLLVNRDFIFQTYSFLLPNRQPDPACTPRKLHGKAVCRFQKFPEVMDRMKIERTYYKETNNQDPWSYITLQVLMTFWQKLDSLE